MRVELFRLGSDIDPPFDLFIICARNEIKLSLINKSLGIALKFFSSRLGLICCRWTSYITTVERALKEVECILDFYVSKVLT